MMDSVEVQFGDYFDQESLNALQKLESALLNRDVDDSLDWYTELNRASLSMQSLLFRNKYPCSSIG